MRTHKVGTFTLGCTLVLFGVLFLVHLFGGVLTYSFIFRLWPVVFLLLGGEVLLSTLPKTGQNSALTVRPSSCWSLCSSSPCAWPGRTPSSRRWTTTNGSGSDLQF